jgi:hypothetical protein
LTSETYAQGSRRQPTAGGIMIMISSCLSALLLIAAIVYALGSGGRERAALAAAGCEPTLTPSMQPCTTQPILASQYLGVITPATEQLNTDAAAYAASEGDHLAVAEAALKAEVTSERALDASLTAFAFPPAIAPLARALIRANQARATLTAEQARSSSLSRMRSFDHQVQLADAAVQTQMRLVRDAVDTPLPTT